RMRHSSTRKRFVSSLLRMRAVWRTVMPVPGHLTKRSCWDMVKAHGCVNDSRKCGVSGRRLSRKITSC
ncbi:hypothetical protein B6Q00_29445, partial [Escherichia coli]|nr:hypothetical protein [Escherichia coli]